MGKAKNLYEKGNHLGNVLVTISDKKIGVDNNSDGTIDYYNADVVTANDYYPFGSQMPGRKYSQANTKYRYGFNGKENDKDISEGGQDYGMRIYDGRLGRFLSADPIEKNYPQLTPYQFASNKPINGVDMDGLEWVLKIYDPQVISDFIKAVNAKDIYAQRGTVFKALNSQLTDQEFINKSKKNPGIVGSMVADQKTGKNISAELVYDKKAPAGVTFQYQTESNGTTDHSLKWDKSKGSNYDDKYPVDVRAVNSPEQKDFYGSYDFVGKFSNVFGSAGGMAGAGTISGFLKGYGRVNYTTQFFGAGTPSAGVETGMLTGNFNLNNVKDYSPSTIAGFGGSQGWGAGIAATGSWYSFANYDDMKNFRTNKATISGEQNAWSLTISPKKLKGFSASRTYSFTTLVEPKKP